MRDAHQSLLATRMRTHDIAAVAAAYARGLPQLFSLECWGGATFDVAMRFLTEDPWERLALIRERVPNILTQMLLRGANGVGYTNYPDNVVRHFVRQAARRRHRSVPHLRLPQLGREHARRDRRGAARTGKLAEGAICYTGDLLDPARAEIRPRLLCRRSRKELEKAGCHILGIKDMAGLLKPAAARALVKALKDEIGLPIHFHTHDTSGIAGATVLAAIDAGVDAVDARDGRDGRHHLAALPRLDRRGAARGRRAIPGLDPEAIRQISFYWEAVRTQYAAFESDLKAPRLRSLSARDAGRAVHQSEGAGARPSAWRRAGTRSPRPIAPPTICSATSSR